MEIELNTETTEQGIVNTMRVDETTNVHFTPTALIDHETIGGPVRATNTSVTALFTFIENRQSEFSVDGLVKAVIPFVTDIANSLDAVIGQARKAKADYDRTNLENRTPKIIPTDNAAAIARANIRDHFNTLNVPDKAKMIASGDVLVLSAILETGQAVSGLNTEIWNESVRQFEIASWTERTSRRDLENNPVPPSTYYDILPDRLQISDFQKQGEEHFNAHHQKAEVFELVEGYIKGIINMIAAIRREDAETTFDKMLNG
jgi:hypothetical protein